MCLGVRRWEGEADDGAAAEGGVEHVVLVPQRSCWRDDADVELLPEVAPLPQLRSEVPHPALSNVSMIAAQDLGYTCIVCLLTASSRL